MNETDSDKARRDAYVREYYGRRWYWSGVSTVTILPAFLFCAAITPEEKFHNLFFLMAFLMVLVNVFWLLDRRRVTKKHFPPKQ
jgi:ABC-type transport system involved in cytochrome c biogenesis permease subunit